ncbi:circadian clock-controlled protein daywake-like [Anabrus simplex]|uniref:circadian clock-controlled protein daywake-like n=1 Tax=Anabrus simplex TaxID=316456 RepID=UPI0035A311A5
MDEVAAQRKGRWILPGIHAREQMDKTSPRLILCGMEGGHQDDSAVPGHREHETLAHVLGACPHGEVLELPATTASYIKKCRRGDDKCYLKSAQAALGHFINGEKNFKLHSLNPFLVQSIEIHQGGLNIKMSNVKNYFPKNLNFKNIRIDFDKMIFGYTLYSPLCQMFADYQVDGKILILPISGSGKCNTTVVDHVLEYEAQCAFETREDGEEYVKFLSGKHTTVSIGRAYYNLENLFNGDKTLGEATLKFMNENWLDIYKELSPLFLEALDEQARITLNNVAGSVPYKKLFLP